jgi:hypothetical protein
LCQFSIVWNSRYLLAFVSSGHALGREKTAGVVIISGQIYRVGQREPAMFFASLTWKNFSMKVYLSFVFVFFSEDFII